MKTRSSEARPGHGLPPPPAPTAPDANPWQMSSGGEVKRHEPRHPRAPGWPPVPRPPAPGPKDRRRGLPWFPLAVLLVILGTGVRTAIRALEDGDVEKAAGALVIFAVVVVVALHRILKRRSR